MSRALVYIRKNIGGSIYKIAIVSLNLRLPRYHRGIVNARREITGENLRRDITREKDRVRSATLFSTQEETRGQTKSLLKRRVSSIKIGCSKATSAALSVGQIFYSHTTTLLLLRSVP